MVYVIVSRTDIIHKSHNAHTPCSTMCTFLFWMVWDIGQVHYGTWGICLLWPLLGIFNTLSNFWSRTEMICCLFWFTQWINFTFEMTGKIILHMKREDYSLCESMPISFKRHRLCLITSVSNIGLGEIKIQLKYFPVCQCGLLSQCWPMLDTLRVAIWYLSQQHWNMNT